MHLFLAPVSITKSTSRFFTKILRRGASAGRRSSGLGADLATAEPPVNRENRETVRRGLGWRGGELVWTGDGGLGWRRWFGPGEAMVRRRCAGGEDGDERGRGRGDQGNGESLGRGGRRPSRMDFACCGGVTSPCTSPPCTVGCGYGSV
uniref:Uncharacterized protein n=7 Tax=Aegilops tauschii subsp. strangulata TaxID=200361 RepID=A0A453PVC5_AEGTS